jgi:predicted  nucleic acid-binding Zn-ribbon protein
LKEQLVLLEDLQRHDARLQEYDITLKALPEKLQSLKNDLAKVETLLDRERASLAEIESFRGDVDSQLKADEGNVAKTKAKMSQVRGGKDFSAVQREVETTRKMIGDKEEEILKLMAAIETSKKSIAVHEKDVAELRAHVATEEASTSAKIAEIQAKITAERVERDQLAAKVRPDVLKRYGSIRIRRGLAVVPVVRGACQGCHMKIPPQLYNLLQRGTSLEACPSCHRIIYWDELMRDKNLERGEGDSPA